MSLPCQECRNGRLAPVFTPVFANAIVRKNLGPRAGCHVAAPIAREERLAYRLQLGIVLISQRCFGCRRCRRRQSRSCIA